MSCPNSPTWVEEPRSWNFAIVQEPFNCFLRLSFWCLPRHQAYYFCRGRLWFLVSLQVVESLWPRFCRHLFLYLSTDCLKRFEAPNYNGGLYDRDRHHQPLAWWCRWFHGKVFQDVALHTQLLGHQEFYRMKFWQMSLQGDLSACSTTNRTLFWF